VTAPILLRSGDPYLDLLKELEDKLDKQDAQAKYFDRYYEGTQPMAFIAPEVAKQVGDRLAPVVINWPRVIVDSVQRRCTVQGFRLGSTGALDADLWSLWTGSEMPSWSRMNHVDSLVHRLSFWSVWADDSEAPAIAPESAHQMAILHQAGSSRVRAALKRFVDDDDVARAYLFLPDRVRRYSGPKTNGLTLVGSPVRWTLDEEIPNPLGAVPVVPMVNRPRVLNLDGESELSDVIPLADAVNKLATDLLITSEFHAAPRRWATGIQVPDGPDRERLQAEVAAYWDNALKGKTWLAGEGVSFGQFAEAQLSNFTGAIQMLTAQIAAVAGLPPHYLGINTDNPASADAIRSAEATLNERAREKHETWGATYKKVMQLAMAVADGSSLAAIESATATLETDWRDPETRTKAQDADAAVKLHAEGIIDDVQAQEAVGLSPMQRQAIAERRTQATETAATADVTARLNLARAYRPRTGSPSMPPSLRSAFFRLLPRTAPRVAPVRRPAPDTSPAARAGVCK
jgi:hypothetical protein